MHARVEWGAEYQLGECCSEIKASIESANSSRSALPHINDF